MHRMIFLTGLLFGVSLVSAQKLLLLPITGYFDNAGDAATLDKLYRDALDVQFKGTVLTPTNDVTCGMRSCALSAAHENGSDEVVFSNLSRLGSKWVFSSTIIAADGSGAFNQTLTALSIDDIGTGIKSVADSLVHPIQPAQNNVAENPPNGRVARRLGVYNSGIAAGYLFPIGHSYGYQTKTSPSEFVQPYSQLLHLTWLNNWNLHENLLLNANLDWDFTNASLGGDLDLDYLLNTSDYAPFIGAGAGIHYVYIGDTFYSNNRYSGPSLDGQGGLLLFQNYNVHVMVRGEYQVIFDSQIDNAFILDVGISFQKL